MLSKFRPIIRPLLCTVKPFKLECMSTKQFSIFSQHKETDENISLRSYINKVGLTTGKLLATSAITGGLTVELFNTIISRIPANIDTFMYLDKYTPIFLTGYGLSLMGSFYHIWQLSDQTKSDKHKMYHAYWMHGLMGIIISPSLIIFNQYIPQALILTSALVVGSIIGTRLIPRGSMLALGPALSTALCGIVGIGFTSIGASFFGLNSFANIAHSINLYGGIILFSLYNVYDTETLIEDYEKGIKNYVNHAVSYSMNILNIFVRILEVLKYLNIEGDDNDDD